MLVLASISAIPSNLGRENGDFVFASSLCIRVSAPFVIGVSFRILLPPPLRIATIYGKRGIAGLQIVILIKPPFFNLGRLVDRRPVDPPPIVALEPVSETEEALMDFLNPNYFMTATLISTKTGQPCVYVRNTLTPTTTGTLASSIYSLRDDLGQLGGFFVFPDLSIRIEGSYRLLFALYEKVGYVSFDLFKSLSRLYKAAA